ncbi:hypothetical protein SDC9_118906 [bioreactor metagenome]|uniref:Uncharacterized protein n=1 Tax=bioreactor metagenome TaxID=1076179 RepID=A0A645C969_9ZZZZ
MNCLVNIGSKDFVKIKMDFGCTVVILMKILKVML